ncbi:MAG: CehA/McbA family metallohydrolase [Pirellulales bacterium]
MHILRTAAHLLQMPAFLSLLFVLPFGILPAQSVIAEDQTIRLLVIDADTKQPIPARVYLTSEDSTPYYFTTSDQQGSAVRYEKQHRRTPISFEFHTTVSAHACSATVPAGKYTLTIEHGKTYFPVTRTIEVKDTAVGLRVPLKRWINMADKGWYSGDTHIHRTIENLHNVVLAEDLNVTFPLTNWVTFADRLPSAGDKNVDDKIPGKLIHVDPTHVIWPRNTEYEIFTVGERRHTLGALFVLGHKEQLKQTVPPWKPVIDATRKAEPHVMFDMDKQAWPFAMTLPPITPDALYELANNHMWRTEFAFCTWTTPAPAYMQPPYGGTQGGEREWIDNTLGMYYTLLNCGFRLPPSAGTANGVHPVPAGFGRVYIHQPDGFHYEDWIKKLAKGNSFVTTGPMLFATADSEGPGHIFQLKSTDKQPETIPIHIEIASETPLSYAELLVNGHPELKLRFVNQKTEQGAYQCSIDTEVTPSRSGWFAVRCWELRTDSKDRFAHTAPWYVEKDDRPVQVLLHEKNYLISRMQAEIDRSQGTVSPAAMEEYRQALKHYQELPVFDDSAEVARNARPFSGKKDSIRWLNNMVLDHQYTAQEVRLASGLSLKDAQQAVAATLDLAQEIPAKEASAKVLPYPGGRHPRRGFFDGAIDPQRETKVSIFPQWENSGYVLIDVPEAIFTNLGLTYLAHTHIPTIWSERTGQLPRLEWVEDDNGLHFERELPNGIKFGTRVQTPVNEGDTSSVDMEMWLTNGTQERLTNMRSQVCVMLKGAIGFNAQVQLEQIKQEPFIAVKSQDADRWLITAWTPTNRAWSNPPVPCIHSDPVFPDCEPGKTVKVNGTIWFYEGQDIDEKLEQLTEEFVK